MEQLEEAKGQLSAQSESDPLTGLCRRHKFDQLFENELVRSRCLGYQLLIVMFNLNHFRRINDLFGHAAGDAVLQALADRFRAYLRQNDVITRIGDTFLILLPETPQEQVKNTTEKIVQVIVETRTEYAGHELQVEARVGAVCYPIDGDNTKSLLDAAEKAMSAVNN